MNICPQCNERYIEDYSFCLNDGTELVSDVEEETTVIKTFTPVISSSRQGVSPFFAYLSLVLIAMLLAGGLFFWVKYSPSQPNNSLADSNSIPTNQSSSAETLSTSNTSVATPSPNPTPDKSQLLGTVNKYLAGVASVQGYREFKESRKIYYGDLDGDGDEDAIVDSVMGYKAGGNFHTQILSAYRNTDGKFDAVTDVSIGGKLYRDAEFKSIANGKINYNLKIYDKDNDPACCPSIKGKTSYILTGEKLIER